jgi:hypothetical protein
MQAVAVRHTFDREDVRAIVTDRKRKARIYPSAIDDDGASAALTAVAALLCSWQIEAFAKKIEKGHPRVIKLDSSGDAIHGQCCREGHAVLLIGRMVG